MRFGVVGVLSFIAVYVASVVVYAISGVVHAHPVTDSPSAGAATTVTIDTVNLESNNSVLLANVTVSPGPALLDPLNHKLKEDLTVAFTSVVTPSTRTWSKGAFPDVFPISLPLAGDVGDWPFDKYRSGPVTVELFPGAAQLPETATVTFVDRLLGWKADTTVVGKADSPGAYQVNLQRTLNTAAFALVILGVLVALAGVALFVAVQTVRDRRKFQPPMTTWYAAMLFAVMPLRNALPDSPPFGCWIDVTIVLWVIVVLVISMTLYISCWWRHLRPENPT